MKRKKPRGPRYTPEQVFEALALYRKNIVEKGRSPHRTMEMVWALAEELPNYQIEMGVEE